MQKSRKESLFHKLKGNRIVAVLLVLAIVVIAVGIFTDATEKISEFLDRSSRFIKGEPTDQQALQVGPRITGVLSYLVVWRFSSNRDGTITDRKFTPAFRIKNGSNVDISIENIRLCLQTETGDVLIVHPTSSVPLEAIQKPCEFHDYEHLSTGGEFLRFDLPVDRSWEFSYSYNVPATAYDKLRGVVRMSVEVITTGHDWKEAFSEDLYFGRHPFHLQEMRGGSQAIFVYARPHKKDDLLYCIDELGEYKFVPKG